MKVQIDSDPETSSVTMAVSGINERDFVAVDEICYAMANYLQSFSRLLEAGDDIPAECEDKFLIEHENLVTTLVDADSCLSLLAHKLTAESTLNLE